jgi:phage tail protein X
MGGGQPPPSFGQPGGGIDWRAAVQAVVQANPGIQQNPRALARAVDHFMPIMNQQSLDQWRQVQGRLRVRPEMQLMEQFYAANPGATPEEAAQFFSDQVKGGQTRKDIAVSGQKSRENIAAAGRESRERIAGRTEAGRQGRFDTRERRLQSKQDFDQAFRTSSQALSRERFEWAKDKATRDQQYKQQKQALDEAHRRMQEHISATAAGDKDVLKNLKKSYDEAVKRLDASFMGKDTNKDMKTGSGTLQAYPVPPERRGDPDGTTYNNGQYRKQGDQMVPVQ